MNNASRLYIYPMNSKLIKWVHVLFWALLICSSAIPDFLSRKFDTSLTVKHFAFSDYLIVSTAYTLISAFIFYGSYLAVAGLLFSKRYIFRAILNATGIFILTVILRYLIEFYFLKPVIGFDNYKGSTPALNYYVSNIFFFYMPSYFMYGIMYYFIENWFITSQHQQEILKEKLTAELVFLRSQINPHYLFNTINDIYTLTYQKADEAPDALLKLSEVLRYMLHESQTEMMPLENEVIYLENVIELQRISAKRKAFIRFNVEGNIAGIRVPFLLFIAFVENAFKHGILADPENPVEINLTTHANFLTFSCSNKKAHSIKDRTGGIGLNNVKRRLELLHSGQYQLDLIDEEGFYRVKLKLNLN
jgi:two-component system LytT family sensor kinase